MSEKYQRITNRVMQKNLFRRRLWVLAASLLLFFIYYVGTVALALAGMRSGEWKAADMRYELLTLFGAEGGDSILAMIAILLAALTAMEGFAWMDRKKQIAFYESQPVSRSGRFWSITLNSFLIYLGSGIVMLAVGLLLAFGYGGGSAKLVQNALIWFVRNAFLFFAVYASSVLAVMLTGNIVIAILAECVFLGSEPLVDLLTDNARSQMFHTYIAPDSIWTHLFSPLMTTVSRSVSAGQSVLINLAGGAALLALAYLIYRRYRRNEDAGKAVLFAPVRQAAKIWVSILISFAVGLTAYSGIGDSPGTAGTIAAIMIAAVIVGAVMEVIYEYNIRSALHHFPSVIIAAGITVLVFCMFRYDWTGYDSWVPEASNVSSAYLFDQSNYYTNHYTDEGKAVGETEDYYRNYMQLTDISAVNAVLKAGEISGRENAKKNTEEDGRYTSLLIGYRMKNGRIVRRSIFLPVTEENRSLLDKVVGTDQFHEGYFQIYHDAYVEKDLSQSKITYWNGDNFTSPYTVPAQTSYAAFKKAYLKDLQKFDFTLACSSIPIGDLGIENDSTRNNHTYFSIDYPVYANFSNTIAFLKENGLWQEALDEKKLEEAGRESNLNGPFDDSY